MNKTRRNFLNAGAIIAIVFSAIFMFLSIFSIAFAPMITTENLCSLYENDTENYKTYYLEDDPSKGIDYFTHTDELGNVTKITVKQVADLAGLARRYAKSVGWGMLISEIATLVCAIFVIVDAHRASNCKAFIIALLILSLYTGNLISFAFMIVGLCLKNTPPVQIEGQS